MAIRHFRPQAPKLPKRGGCEIALENAPQLRDHYRKAQEDKLGDEEVARRLKAYEEARRKCQEQEEEGEEEVPRMDANQKKTFHCELCGFDATSRTHASAARIPRPSIYPLSDPECPLFGTIYPYLRVQGGSWYSNP